MRSFVKGSWWHKAKKSVFRLLIEDYGHAGEKDD